MVSWCWVSIWIALAGIWYGEILLPWACSGLCSVLFFWYWQWSCLEDFCHFFFFLHLQLKLTTLDVAVNRISRLENISHLVHLEEFWVSIVFVSFLPFVWNVFHARLSQQKQNKKAIARGVRAMHAQEKPFSNALCFLFISSSFPGKPRYCNRRNFHTRFNFVLSAESTKFSSIRKPCTYYPGQKKRPLRLCIKSEHCSYHGISKNQAWLRFGVQRCAKSRPVVPPCQSPDHADIAW